MLAAHADLSESKRCAGRGRGTSRRPGPAWWGVTATTNGPEIKLTIAHLSSQPLGLLPAGCRMWASGPFARALPTRLGLHLSGGQAGGVTRARGQQPGREGTKAHCAGRPTPQGRPPCARDAGSGGARGWRGRGPLNLARQAQFSPEREVENWGCCGGPSWASRAGRTRVSPSHGPAEGGRARAAGELADRPPVHGSPGGRQAVAVQELSFQTPETPGKEKEAEGSCT